jgi:hypothetical protein
MPGLGGSPGMPSGGGAPMGAPSGMGGEGHPMLMQLLQRLGIGASATPGATPAPARPEVGPFPTSDAMFSGSPQLKTAGPAMAMNAAQGMMQQPAMPDLGPMRAFRPPVPQVDDANQNIMTAMRSSGPFGLLRMR